MHINNALNALLMHIRFNNVKCYQKVEMKSLLFRRIEIRSQSIKKKLIVIFNLNSQLNINQHKNNKKNHEIIYSKLI